MFYFFPFQMLGGYGEFLYQTGMIDELQRQYVIQQTDLGVKLIHQQKWVEAFQVRDAGCLLHNKRIDNKYNWVVCIYTFLIGE